ncbi:hypothetical protein SAMN04488696_2987 [Methanolobus profundi]|uniref:Uncharacterized protein n=1 Tax=Methanolobus profundi TaxID=487685 RepID=A0A1I4V2Z9_9EURY|nr:hypothetical protein SAMN04488696_2987 [Methanolobus profundi]
MAPISILQNKKIRKYHVKYFHWKISAKNDHDQINYVLNDLRTKLNYIILMVMCKKYIITIVTRNKISKRKEKR